MTDFEHRHAIREGEQNAASESYFTARPQIDTNDRRKAFQAGFERGWDSAASAAGEPVAYAVFSDNGNIRLWSQQPIDHPDAQPLYKPAFQRETTTREVATPPIDGEIALIEKAVQRVGIKSLLNHGAGSLVWSEGVNGVTQGDLVAYTREIALHCAVALSAAAPTKEPGGA
ncbi:hypothetical protein [Acidovorax sp.]|uniref:hypothetical protein n=1 Tax=Acidovorax sp. TaxID=1872122 RepID=UPI0025C151A7|nr:hypothetical protein [Acidovorax sp.]MBL7091557.1 hypothetical protein [Acidovorax sp.]